MEKSTFSTSRIYPLKDSVEYSEGAIVSKIVARKDAGNITLFAFDEGQELSEHSAPFDAIVQLIEGEARFTIAGQEYKLTAGDLLIMPANISHSAKALKRFKMLLTMLKSS